MLNTYLVARVIQYNIKIYLNFQLRLTFSNLTDNSIKNRWHVIVRNQVDDNGFSRKVCEGPSDSSDHEPGSSHQLIVSSSSATNNDGKQSNTPRFKRCHSLLYDGVQQQLESSRSFSFLPFEEIESNIVPENCEEKVDMHCLSPHTSSDETVWMDDYLVDEDIIKPLTEENVRDGKKITVKKTAPILPTRILDQGIISVDDLRPGLFQDMLRNKRMCIFH